MKKNITTFIALMSTLLISASLWGQSSLVPFDAHSAVWGGMFAPQSPESMAITRYGDHAPDLYHGGVSLSIPVFHWKDNLFDIPISLEYSSSGYRPGAACGPEGLGWALNAGGVITREVRGIPDETWHQGCSATALLYANPSGTDHPVSEYIFPNPNDRYLPDPYDGYALRGFANWYNSNSSSYASSTLEYIYTGGLLNEFVCGSVITGEPSMLVENEPDIFYFSFLGRSGSFILGPNHSVRFLNCNVPSGELSVVFDFIPTQEGTGSSFTITDGQGVKYCFSDTETASSFDALHGNDEGGAAVSCWRLSSITHPSGKEVSFSYSESLVSNISPVVTADHITVSDGTGTGSGHPIFNQWTDDPGYFDTSLIYNSVWEQHLSSIDFAERGSADFYWDSNGRLTSIYVYNEDGRLLKECDLSYYVPKNTAGLRHNKLAFLSSLSLSGEGTYTFAYDSANDNCRFPYDSGNSNTDLWYTDAFGYYSDVSLKTLFNYNYSSLSALAAYIDSHRTPDLSRTRMGTLSRVTYPAGGRSDFSYELNTWSRKNDANQTVDTSNPVTGGLRVSRIDTYDENGSQVQCRKYYYTDSNGCSSGVLLQYPQIFFKYQFTSNTPGVCLKVEREAVSTTSNIGFMKNSHIEYLRVVESISRTSSSPTLSLAVHEFNSASSISDCSCETEYLHDAPVNQTEFTFTNNGTVLSEWLNHGVSFFAGKPSTVSQESVSSSDPQTSTDYVYDTYADIGGSSWSGKTICFGRLCERVYNTSSPYTASTTVYETAASGPSSSVTTSFAVDSRGRLSEVISPDSHGATLSTTYSYHTVLPGLVTQKTVTRGGSAVSSVKYDYYCKNSNTSWYVPQALSSRLVTGSTFGTWHTERTFASWDSWGNPCSVTDAAGRTTSWTWGYSGMYPVGCSRTSSGATLQQSWTWIPMVGLSSAIDPSGRTTSYYYDSHGRLTSVMDAEGSTLVSHNYYFPGTGDLRTYSNRTYIASTTYSGGGGATDVVYYDGLGRILQTVQRYASGNNNTDLIVPSLPDAFGRPLVEEYPYPRASNSGSLRTSWSGEQEAYYENAGYAGGDDYLFGIEHTYENRPNGRVLSTTLPGYGVYAENGSQISYGFNSSGQVNGYSYGTCSGSTTTDGDGHVSTVWKDREGRTVQEDRHPDVNTKLSTRYSYDDRGNLSDMIQPKGTVFSYSYDSMGRMIMKMNPDSGAELFVYDSAGRVVLSQNPLLADQGRWILSTWDDFDCLTRRQIISTNLSQSALQAYFPVTGSGSLPSSSYNVVATIEEYGYMRSNGATVSVPSTLVFVSDASVTSSDLGSSLNLKIYEKVLSLPETGASASVYSGQPYVERAFYHDALGREMQTVERNILGGIIRTSVVRDCQGNPLFCTESVTLSANDSNPTVKHTIYDYDSRGRIISESVAMNGSSVSSTTFAYDALGRLSSVSGNGLQQTQTYTFQGWTASILAKAGSTDVFSETLRYAEALHALPLYSGTISEILWKHGTSTPSTYAFFYDGTGRLTDCYRYSGSTLDNAWTERGIDYDANGNITAISRYGQSGSTPVDNLTMTYSDNTLNYVGGSHFSHDSAGNLTYDPLRSLTFSYSFLNRPCTVSTSTDEADYSFLADGTKALVLGEQSEDGYAYIGSMVFALSEGDWLFDSTPFAGGMIRRSGSSFVADRHATDHLGSVRAVVRGGQVLERNDYYPYGGRHANASLAVDSSNRWRFSCKEIQTTAGVNLLDFGARFYDDRLCRWTTQDPLAEKYPAFSPYVYCKGDTVNRLDADGEIDRKVVKDGAKVTAFGVLSIVAGALEVGSMNPYIAYLGASSIASGISEVGFGTGKIIIGLASDGSDEMTRAANSIPNSVHEALGQAFDAVLNDENQTTQTIFSLIDLGVDIAELNTSTYKVVDIIKTINDAANAYNKTYNCITTTLCNDTKVETDDNENHLKQSERLYE